MNKDLKSDQNGELSAETTARRQDLPSTGEAQKPTAKSGTSATSATTRKAKSQPGSQATINLEDVSNVSRLLVALAAKLGSLVFWKRVKLSNGELVYALCFPLSRWQVDADTKELKLRDGRAS